MSSMPEHNVRQRVDGIAAFISKPFELARVIKLVESVLSLSRPSP